MICFKILVNYKFVISAKLRAIVDKKIGFFERNVRTWIFFFHGQTTQQKFELC